MATLPVELLENIFQHVYGSYQSPKLPTDLYRCALVCRTWHILAQPLIFTQLQLHDLDKRIQTLQEDPQLCQYVRQVWVLDVDLSLPTLPNLKELYILDDRPGLQFLQSLEHRNGGLLRNLTSLGLSEVERFPIKYLVQCKSLRHLKMNNSTLRLKDEPPATPLNGRQRPQLQSLYVGGHTNLQMKILDWMLGPQLTFDLAALNSFRVVDRTNELKPYHWTLEVIKLCGSTLEDLFLDPPTAYATSDLEITPNMIPHPSLLSNLRTITITISQEEKGDYTTYIPLLNALFSLLPTNNRLEEIQLPCLFVDIPRSSDAELVEHMNRFGWETLDKTLISSHLKLRRVAIRMYELHGPPRVSEMEALLRSVLPDLDEKGILDVICLDSSKGFRFGILSSGDRWWQVNPNEL